MRAQLVFDNKIESKKSYLTRMARLLDVIRNRPEQICRYPQIAGISPDEVREFENYLCKIIEPEVKKAAELATYKNKIIEYTDVVTNIALVSVMRVLHTYNAPAAVAIVDGFSVDTFIVVHIKNAVREAFKEKTGLKKHQLDKANRVRKAKNYIATTMQKPYDTIDIEDIYKAQTKISNAKPLSRESIMDVLNYMETQVHIDEIEKFEVASNYDSISEIESDEIKEQLHAVLLKMKKAQRYIFLKRLFAGEERITYKQLAKETRLIELCKEDEVCRRNLMKGSLKISRPGGKETSMVEEYTDIVYLKIDYMDYLYRDALKKIRKFIIENELFPADLEGWIEEWILDEFQDL